MISFTHGKLSFMFSLALACAFFVSSADAQYKEWRPISPEDLAAKTPVVDKDADAEALFWEQRIDDSSLDDLDMWHYVRVKIFTERGRETFSKFDIPYTRDMKIKNLMARVIKADGTIIDVAEKDIFDREIVKAGGVKVKAKSFAVPNIEPGVIVEYKYKEAIDDAGASGMRLQLQRDLPVRKLTYYYKPYKGDPSYQTYNIDTLKFTKHQKGFWIAERTNVPAFKEEPRMPPEDTVRPWLLLTSPRLSFTSVSAFSISFTIKDPSNPEQYWASFAAERSGLLEKLILKPNKEIKRIAEQLTAGAANDEERLRRLYEFCQKEIKNLPYDQSLTTEQRRKIKPIESIGDILKARQAGLSTYVDYLFGALAGSLGMDVRLTFTGNKSKMFFDPKMANEQLVHLSAIAIKVGEKYMYFNPGDPFLPFGMMPWHDEESWALLVGPKNYLWQDTPVTPASRNAYKRVADLTLKDDGTLEGTVSIEITGQPALTYRQSNFDETPEKRGEFLKESVKARLSTAEVSDAVVENVLDHTKPVVQRYRVSIPNYAQKTGKRMFFQPGFFENGPSALFSSSDRKFSVFFPYPWSENDSITVKLPAGFALDSVESPGTVNDPGNITKLDISLAHDKAKNALLYERKFYFGNTSRLLFPVNSYVPLKSIFDAFHKADTQPVTLKQE